MNQKSINLITGLNLFIHRKLIPKLFSYAYSSFKKPHNFILDFGCGNGLLESRLTFNDKVDVLGIDVSAELVQYAKRKKNANNIHWIVCDGTKLPLRNNIFDIVFVIGVLHHIKDYTVAISEIKRVLKKDGLLLGCEPNILHPHLSALCPAIFAVVSRFIPKTVACLSADERPLHPIALIEILQDAGFAILYHDFMLSFKFLLAPLDLIFGTHEFVLHVYESLAKLDFLVPKFLRNSFLFVCQKIADDV
jgi:ubiquinone/menaquinone biosynthesis C-methylase UbiE